MRRHQRDPCRCENGVASCRSACSRPGSVKVRFTEELCSILAPAPLVHIQPWRRILQLPPTTRDIERHAQEFSGAIRNLQTTDIRAFQLSELPVGQRETPLARDRMAFLLPSLCFPCPSACSARAFLTRWAQHAGSFEHHAQNGLDRVVKKSKGGSEPRRSRHDGFWGRPCRRPLVRRTTLSQICGTDGSIGLYSI